MENYEQNKEHQFVMQTSDPQLTKILHCHEQEREIPLGHRYIKTLFYIMGGIQ